MGGQRLAPQLDHHILQAQQFPHQIRLGWLFEQENFYQTSLREA